MQSILVVIQEWDHRGGLNKYYLDNINIFKKLP